MKAFSEKNPNLQLAWDASSLKSYQFCPRSYQLQNLEGWQTESVDLEFGKRIATGLEMYQKLRLVGKSVADATLEVAKWAMEETWNDGKPWGGEYETMWKCEGTEKYKNPKGNRAVCPFAHKRMWFPGGAPALCGSCGSGIRIERRFVAEHTKNRQSLVRALIWYGLSNPDDLDDGYRPYVFPDGTPAVELSGKLPLPFTTASTGERYVLTWNFDYIGDFGGELWITDNKSTSKTLDAKFESSYAVDTQFDTYDLVGTLMFPELNIQGTMVEGIQVLESGIAIERFVYRKTEAQREEHFRDIELWLQDAERSAVENYWRMNKRNCWLCSFKRVCRLDPKKRQMELEANFTKGPRWDPTAER